MKSKQNAQPTAGREEPGAFEMQIDIDAPPEAVWKALTDARELTRWFPLDASVTPGPGGTIRLSWGPECEGTAPITIWEPERRLQWTEQVAGEADAPVLVTVEITLKASRGRTTIRLVHSGFGRGGKWDDYCDSIGRGWNFELRGLRHYLEHHRGKDRRVVWARRKITVEPDEAAKRVIGAEGRVLRGVLAGLHEGDAYRLDLVGGDALLEGLVRVNALPRSFAGSVANLNQSFLRFEIDNLGSGLEAWLWLSTYGLGDEPREHIERHWNAALEQAFES